MAESVQLALSDNQYLCHACETEVSICRMAELICPSCSSEFVEELTQEPDDELDIYADLDRLDGIRNVDEEIPAISDLGMNNLISQMLLNVANIRELESGEIRDDDDDEEDDDDDNDEEDDEWVPPLLNRLVPPLTEELYEGQGVFSARARHMIGSTMRYLNIDGLDDDLDLLASQLLDEIDLSGPGPLPKEQIKQLKTVAISQEQVASGLQCTVCMEDFTVNEETKSLKCGHFYHEKCLEPWLQRQATCPNCRKTVEAQASKHSQSCSPHHPEDEPQRNAESASSSTHDCPSQRERYRHIFL